jgi:hypothetical protein
MLIIYIRIYLSLRTENSDVVKNNSIKALKKLAIYPVILTICLTGVAYIDTYNALFQAHSASSSILQFVSYGLPYLIGTFTSIIFFISNPNTLLNSDTFTRLTEVFGVEMKNSFVVKETLSDVESKNQDIIKATISNPLQETISDSI